MLAYDYGVIIVAGIWRRCRTCGDCNWRKWMNTLFRESHSRIWYVFEVFFLTSKNRNDLNNCKPVVKNTGL